MVGYLKRISGTELVIPEYKKTLQNITILGKIYVFCHNVKEFGNFVF